MMNIQKTQNNYKSKIKLLIFPLISILRWKKIQFPKINQHLMMISLKSKKNKEKRSLTIKIKTLKENLKL